VETDIVERSSRIMIVDDEAVIITQLEEMLQVMGYKVVGTAGTGAEAMKLAERVRPDLILMDIVMPGELDGIDACARIQKNMKIPVVFLSAYSDESYVERAKAVHPYGYILKPYQNEQIKAALEVALRRKKFEHELFDELSELQKNSKSCEFKFKEIHHRIRNKLNLIISIINMYVTEHEDEECIDILNRVWGRISSISEIHNKLYYSNKLNSVNCKEYMWSLLNSLLSLYHDPDNVKLIMDCQDLHLNTEKILPLGLIVTELVTNSIKYAFPENRAGEITIRLRKMPEGFVLTIKDNGVGLPENLDIVSTRTIGLQLVTALVSQLGGEIKTNDEPGAAYSIRFPA